MLSYLIKRILLIFPTLIGVSILVFVISWTVPGGPVEQQINNIRFSAENSNSSFNKDQNIITDEQIAYLKEYYGYDKPIAQAYFDWLIKAMKFDFGVSYRYAEPVVDLIVERLPISLYFGLVTTIITYLICIPLGIAKALKHGGYFDNITTIIVLIGYAIPAFIFGLILVYSLGRYLPWLPISGFVSENFSELSLFEKTIDLIKHTLMPTACYLVGSFAYLTILVKNSFIENLSQPYIRSAIAYGLDKKVVYFKHALRNSLIPLASTFGQNISLVFTGSFLIETIFNINGLGLLGYQSVTERDYPVVLGTLFISTILFLVGNILSDLSLAAVDPRIRFH